MRVVGSVLTAVELMGCVNVHVQDMQCRLHAALLTFSPCSHFGVSGVTDIDTISIPVE